MKCDNSPASTSLIITRFAFELWKVDILFFPQVSVSSKQWIYASIDKTVTAVH